MKGITPIISIIVLLLITVSLAGAAYFFLINYMQGYTGQALQASGVCVSGTEAYITVTNMGTQAITLTDDPLNPTKCCDGAGCTHVKGTSGDCGDITLVRTDGERDMDAYFEEPLIKAAEPGKLSKAVFRDKNCTALGTPGRCTYAFTRAGEIQLLTVTVNCGG